LFFSFVAITVSPAKQEGRRTGIQAGMTASGITVSRDADRAGTLLLNGLVA